MLEILSKNSSRSGLIWSKPDIAAEYVYKLMLDEAVESKRLHISWGWNSFIISLFFLLSPLFFLLCSTAGTDLHHLLRDSFRSGQSEQLAALLTLWLANPCWSLAFFLPACHWTFSRPVPGPSSALSLSRLCPGLPFMCPANGPGGIWGYVNNLMRSNVWEPPLLFSHPKPHCRVWTDK